MKLIGTTSNHRFGVAGALLLLGPGQLISWGTLYYAMAFLAVPISLDTGWRQQEIFLIFSAALLVAAITTHPVGVLLSRYGGRAVLRAGSVVATLALLMIALSPNMVIFTVGWLLAGVAMSLSQYEPAFATVRALEPYHFRQALGWLTIVGGFASTVFWPLTHWLADTVGWRQTLLWYAALHAFPCLLLHNSLPTMPGAKETSPDHRYMHGKRKGSAVTILLAAAFAAVAAVTTTISTQAAVIMAALHTSTEFSLFILALVGPMQVAGRLLDLGWGSSIAASTVGRIAMGVLVIGLLLLAYADYLPWALPIFAVAYGMANGLLTLVRGNVPAELMPRHDYAVSLALISGPAMVVRAVTPVFASWIVALWGAHTIPFALLIMALIAYASFHTAIVAARLKKT